MLLAQIAAASPAPTPDLSSALAPAPGSDLVEAGSTPRVLAGPFTAEQYASYLQTVSATPNSIDGELRSYGFVGGYAREWVQRGTNDVLVERVFQFDADSGAGFWYHQLRLENRTSRYFERDINGLESIPESFGVVLKAPNGDREYRVEFTKGSAVLVVHMISSATDLEAATVKQAMAEYNAAPGPTPSRTSRRATGVPSWLLIAGIGTLLLLFAVTVAFVLLAVVIGRRRGSAPAPVTHYEQIQMSPDGAYWWDGTRWRDTGVEVPPGAKRSPDRFYWWDGRSWRRTGG